MEYHKLYKFLCCVLGTVGLFNSIYNCLIYDLRGRSTSPRISSTFSSFSLDKIPFLGILSIPFVSFRMIHCDRLSIQLEWNSVSGCVNKCICMFLGLETNRSIIQQNFFFYFFRLFIRLFDSSIRYCFCFRKSCGPFQLANGKQ